MNFFQKALEYSKLAKGFNGYYLMLQQVIEKSMYGNIVEDLLIIALIGRIEIIDRMELINYKLTTKIVVPMLPGENKTLGYAYQQTIVRLMEIAENQGCSEYVNEILDKGELFYELEKTIPDHFRKMMN